MLRGTWLIQHETILPNRLCYSVQSDSVQHSLQLVQITGSRAQQYQPLISVTQMHHMHRRRLQGGCSRAESLSWSIATRAASVQSLCSLLHSVLTWVALWHKVRPAAPEQCIKKGKVPGLVTTSWTWWIRQDVFYIGDIGCTPRVCVAKGSKAVEALLLDPPQPVRFPATSKAGWTTLLPVNIAAQPPQRLFRLPRHTKERQVEPTSEPKLGENMGQICPPRTGVAGHLFCLIISRRSMSLRSCSGSISSSSFFLQGKVSRC